MSGDSAQAQSLPEDPSNVASVPPVPPAHAAAAAIAGSTEGTAHGPVELSAQPSQQPTRADNVHNASDHAHLDGAADHELPTYSAIDERSAHENPLGSGPAYGGSYAEVKSDHEGLGTGARLTADGRVDIRITQRSRRLSNVLTPALQNQLDLAHEAHPLPPAYIPPSLGGAPGQVPPPPLNVVIHVVGSRGDVQPFVALGKVLKETYGHRVRLATHPVFKDFVGDNGLEFFSIGGDPSELMAFMVKNPGLMPGFDTLRSGDVGKRRKGIAEMIKGCWRSCIEAGDGFGPEASDSLLEDAMSIDSGISMSSGYFGKPFVADAIIANPPSFAHIHCAEKLGIPLHMMFTMPWSPTQAFPHPLANIQGSDADARLNNFLSYALVDMLTWQGLGDVINRFRTYDLGLEPVGLMWAPGMLARLRVPWTYCWSPALIPKPRDWSPHISISGFYFLSLGSNYTPADDLLSFLNAGPPPVYIGFGSIVVDDPNAMTKLILEAVVKTGQRALVSKGWGGLGAHEIGLPEGVFMLGNVPHDWLFQHVSCVVHHGGAGTTAAGIAAGRPTVVVPFFGDQPFWGAMVARAGAGPNPVPYKHLTAESLAEAILEALKPESLERAKQMSLKISEEKGTDNGSVSFHQMLQVDNLRCSICPSRAAIWRVKRTNVRLSGFAATVLGNEGLLDFGDLKLYRPREYDTEDEPWDPITGGASAIVGTFSSMLMGVADLPVETLKALRIQATDVGNRKGSQASTLTKSESPGVKEDRGRTMSASTRDSISAASMTSSMAQLQLSSSHASGSPVGSAPLTPVTTDTSTVRTSEEDSIAPTTTKSSMSTVTTVRPTLSPRDSFVSQALGQSIGRTHSKSSFHCPCGHHRSESHHRAELGPKYHIETALGTGKGLSRMVGAGLKSPMDFSMALARGFHNAPKLYGDKVRPTDKITDLQSGLKAAGKEFGYGFYDGITGVVTQPYAGAKQEGPAGFIKGVGRGLSGLILKPGAAIWGLPGYSFKGIYKEIHKHFGSSTQNYIIAARTVQGYDEWSEATAEEREDVIKRWRHMQKDLKKKKNTAEEHMDAFQKFFDARKEKRRLAKDHRKGRKTSEAAVPAQPDEDAPLQDLTHAHTYPLDHRDAELAHEADIEQAIRESVAQSSRGDSEQDYLIERAIRASMAELQKVQSEDLDHEEALHKAMQASIAEARNHAGGEVDADELEAALRNSILEARRQHLEDSGVDTEDDEDIKRVLEDSKQTAETPARHDVHPDDDEDLRKAIDESTRAQAQFEQDQARAKMEEQIVLDYVKRQSIVEADYRQAMSAPKETDIKGEDSADELEKAMKMSLERDERENDGTVGPSESK